MATQQKATPKKMSKAQRLADRRKIRADLGADKDIMKAPDVPGFVLRWVNDELRGGTNRVNKLKSLGWEVYGGEEPEVSPPNEVAESNITLGDGAIMAVGTDRDGHPMNAVLMMIPEDIYQMDQDLKEEEIRSTEEGIFEQGDGQEGMYGGVRIGK